MRCARPGRLLLLLQKMSTTKHKLFASHISFHCPSLVLLSFSPLLSSHTPAGLPVVQNAPSEDSQHMATVGQSSARRPWTDPPSWNSACEHRPQTRGRCAYIAAVHGGVGPWSHGILCWRSLCTKRFCEPHFHAMAKLHPTMPGIAGYALGTAGG